MKATSTASRESKHTGTFIKATRFTTGTKCTYSLKKLLASPRSKNDYNRTAPAQPAHQFITDKEPASESGHAIKVMNNYNILLAPPIHPAMSVKNQKRACSGIIVHNTLGFTVQQPEDQGHHDL